LDRDELIPLVSALLAEATARNDLPVIAVCEELGQRLVREGEEIPNDTTKAAILEMQCPRCAARRAKRTELQRNWRHRKKDNPVGKRQRQTK